MISCKDVSELVSASLDRRLSNWERFKVRTHLMICKGCVNFSKQMKVLRIATRRLAEGGEAGGSTQVRLSEEARSRIRGAMQEQDHRHEDPQD
ncbi:MAG: zf-HC2 domain-containing protein [Gammaproteobacteria bacterium]